MPRGSECTASQESQLPHALVVFLAVGAGAYRLGSCTTREERAGAAAWQRTDRSRPWESCERPSPRTRTTGTPICPGPDGAMGEHERTRGGRGADKERTRPLYTKISGRGRTGMTIMSRLNKWRQSVLRPSLRSCRRKDGGEQATHHGCCRESRGSQQPHRGRRWLLRVAVQPRLKEGRGKCKERPC